MADLNERKARYEYECRRCHGTIEVGEQYMCLSMCSRWPHTRHFHIDCWED